VADVVTYFHNDVSGSPLAATDATGNVLWKENYKPYGEKLTRSPVSAGNKIGFHGKAFDDGTGLSYMRARQYDPVLGKRSINHTRPKIAVRSAMRSRRAVPRQERLEVLH
jgi:uncharacterized protein RhaS with RHS repeats